MQLATLESCDNLPHGSGNAEFGVGEIGCIFDEIQNLVEPIERRYMDVSAGPQPGRVSRMRRRPVCGGAGFTAAESHRAAERRSSYLIEFRRLIPLCPDEARCRPDDSRPCNRTET